MEIGALILAELLMLKDIKLRQQICSFALPGIEAWKQSRTFQNSFEFVLSLSLYLSDKIWPNRPLYLVNCTPILRYKQVVRWPKSIHASNEATESRQSQAANWLNHAHIRQMPTAGNRDIFVCHLFFFDYKYSLHMWWGEELRTSLVWNAAQF